MLLPSLRNAKDAGKRAYCAGNLRQIGLALNLYAVDYNGQVRGDNYTIHYGISSTNFSRGFGVLIGSYLPPAKSCQGPSVWRCPAQTDDDGPNSWLTELPFAWDASQDRARWRGCYSFAFRAKDPVSGAIGNPVNFYGTNAWDAVALREGNFALAFDHLRVASAGTPFLPGRYSCHPAGYNCVYYDGHVQFFGGSQADTIDFRVTTSTTSYNGNFNSCRWVFDRSQGIIY